jgi:hypothetical protein
MPCCKAQEFGNWCEEAPLVDWRDKEGKEYCLFHAPAEHKNITTEEFNQLVFVQIDKAINEERECKLSGTIFIDDINFSRYNEDRPLPDINLNNAFFPKMVSFQSTHFSDYAWFRDVKFQGWTDFRLAEFKGPRVSLESAKFYKLVQFNGAKFYKNENNGSNEFPETYFNGTEFHGDAEFRETVFYTYVTFKAARFKQAADFHKTTFNDQADFLNLEIEMKLRMEEVDLSKLSFLDTDLRKVHFINCTFPKEKSRAPFNSRREILFDEEQLKALNAEEFIRRAEKVETLYRQMKQKAQEEHDMYAYSFLHYSEKEIMWRRTRLIKSPFRWFVLWAYRLFSGFGEDPLKAFGFLLLFVLLSGWLISSNGGPECFEQLAAATLKHLAFIKPGLEIPDTFGGMATVFVTRILVPIQAALFGFALRNRFRR